MGPEVRYPITKELIDRAFESSRGAYEVMIYAETGHWPLWLGGLHHNNSQ